ncbi:GH92 family glycosyl hydrolase [Mucilaginibacter sp.]|uniref:GH92 family glycosyl hydrolase n=1 Tax=Mucilaginibacter sp. TaxID=1882438 RepID=UPI00262B3562|nr:GH92 family glycosyl hydrolase [Mucilaginibacter sp.]MDB5029377.1 glycoside hydrolase family 92 protein [Mucilaginibacter sp.]
MKLLIKQIAFSILSICIMLFINLNIADAQKKAKSVPALTSFVDPMIGAGGHGHVFVGASVPFGAVQVGPDNHYKGWDWCSGYNYADSLMIGFAQTHLSGTGIGDLADILIMPYTGRVRLSEGINVVKTPATANMVVVNGTAGVEQVTDDSYSSRYSHQSEKVKPGYYSVKLLNYGVDVELTATERVAFHRYHFPAGKEGHIIIDLKTGINSKSFDCNIKQLDPYTLVGRRKSKGWAKDRWIFFAIKSSVPLTKFNVYNDTQLMEGTDGTADAIKGLISFDKAPSTVMLKVGISPVSPENALDNIKAEIPGWDFESVVKQADAKWNKELSTLSVETRSLSDKRIFYTSLFHTMIDPAMFNDHNGDYRGTDKKVYTNVPFTNYSIFSLWDTYRAANPLYILTQPKRTADMINTMLAIYDQQGKLPIWHLDGNETGTMVGISSMQVIAEAYLKGIKGFDAQRAYNAIKGTASQDFRGLNYVKDFKYIPSDAKGGKAPVASALEYGVSDGSTALMAKQMGKMDDYDYFAKRAQEYKQYYDPADGFFKGKLANGQFVANYSPTSTKNNLYSEGNGWQYLWLVPQDVKGLISLLGGDKKFNNKLDSLFVAKAPASEGVLADLTGEIGQYAHGDEPSHATIYLYDFSGEQWKTAEKSRYITKNFYPDNTDGIIGNEDCGQMSAWYVFSSMGFYPVFPASGQYVIGSPVVNKATIQTTSGKPFTVQAVNNSDKNIYIQSISLNGKNYKNSFITHKQMMQGGTMIMTMGSKPNYNFGTEAANRP